MPGLDPGLEVEFFQPRVACKLGQIPSLVVSTEAADAPLQVQTSPAPGNEWPVGPYRVLAKLYPQDKAYFGIGGSNNSSLRSAGLRLREAVGGGQGDAVPHDVCADRALAVRIGEPKPCCSTGDPGASRERPVRGDDGFHGGLYPPHDVDPANRHMIDCFVLMRVTRNGFVYDEKATQPNSSIYNCAPDNIAKLSKTYQ